LYLIKFAYLCGGFKKIKQTKMKKLFVLAVAAGLFFVACNGGSTPAADSTATTVDTMNTAPATEAPADAAAAVDTAAVAAPAADSAATPAN
jgi:hypothetical protein